jgi:hypothetical protein
MQQGAFEGTVTEQNRRLWTNSNRFDDFPVETHAYVDGCREDAVCDLVVRPKLLRHHGNDCVILSVESTERQPAGSDSEWFKTNLRLSNRCQSLQHVEFLLGKENFGKPSRPIMFGLGRTPPRWPASKPTPPLPFSLPLYMQVNSSVSLEAGGVATATHDELIDKGAARPPRLVYVLASCDAFLANGKPQAVFRDVDVLNWVCMPVRF